MQDITLTAKSHLDFSGLGDLKAKAKQDQQGAAQEVGRQFEAMFVQMIFKSPSPEKSRWLLAVKVISCI